jgi:hypothetical protein
MKWTQIKKSQQIFNTATVINLMLYFWPAFVSIDHIYSEEALTKYATIQEFQAALFNAVGEELALKNGFAIWLPFFLAIPSGSIRGAMNMMGLVNDSAVPGCLVILLTPFGMLIYLSIFTTVVQTYGNWLMGTGFLLLIISKMKVFYYRSLYITGDVKAMREQNVGLKGLVFLISGIACIVAWVFVTEYEGQTFAERYLTELGTIDIINFAHGWFTKVCM